MANEGSTKPTVNGFCEKHQPNQAVQYAGCWVCSRNEDTEMLREVLRAFGWMKDKEAGWYLAGDADDCPKFYDFHDAVAAALDDYDGLREAHKKAHLYGAGQKVRADKLEAENLRVRGLLQRLFGLVESGGLVRNLAHDGDMMAFMRQSTLLVSTLAQVQAELNPPNFPQSSSLVPSGAESADMGKLDAVDEDENVLCAFCPTRSPDGTMKACIDAGKCLYPDKPVGHFALADAKSGVEMGKVNRVEGKA